VLDETVFDYPAIASAILFEADIWQSLRVRHAAIEGRRLNA
jgi:hypothetical protein